MNPDQVGDTEESSDKTKNPKKLRKQKAMGELGEAIRNPESRKKLRAIMDTDKGRKGDASKGENPRSKYPSEKSKQALHLLHGSGETGSKGNPVRSRGGTNAPADERVGKGPNRAKNAAYWAGNAGPTRDRGAGNKAKRRAAELGEQSYQIDTAAHKSAQKIEKIRNLASGTNNENEKNAAMRKLSGPSLPLANSFEPEIINHLIENGFAETEQNALKIMENMSESWSEEIITELNRLEREQGKESGGNPDKAYQHVKKMIRGMEGKPPGQRKKQRGGATPGPNTTPAQKIAKRRAAAQQSQDMMHSRYD
jgi:hypothetical protein